ncbi:MAG: GntR family transcriptional regulator [Salinibacterium sp.]|nr:GntR family transcriptional regulator [Salinibacterium sp.]
MMDEEDDKVTTSKVVVTVFEQILSAVHEGTLLPGQRISDAALAQEFGVSRTPVREALQRLREIGIIEASPSRFTRVAVVTPDQTAQAYVVWLALYRALIEEVVPRAPDGIHVFLEQEHERFLGSLEAKDVQGIATANFLFFSRLSTESTNPALQRAIVSVVHIVRLGSLNLPEYIDVEALGRAQKILIEAVRLRDVVMARASLKLLATIRVPLN